MKITFLSLYCYLLFCAHGAFAQTITFDDGVKKKYVYATVLEKKINTSPDNLQEVKVKRKMHPLDSLLDRHFYFVPAETGYRVSIFFCKTDANAKKYGKGVFSKEKKENWIVKDGILLIVSSSDKAKVKEILAYLSE
jgi:hypothetical protein